MFRLTVALLAVAAWGYAESPLWNDFAQVSGTFDNTNYDPRMGHPHLGAGESSIRFLNQDAGYPSLALPGHQASYRFAALDQTPPIVPGSPEGTPMVPPPPAKDNEQASKKEGFGKYFWRQFKMPIFVAIGGVGGFLLNKVIQSAAEGGPILKYSLILGGFLAVVVLAAVIIYFTTRREEKDLPKEDSQPSRKGFAWIGNSVPMEA